VKKDHVVGLAWCGRFNDGSLGWAMPAHVTGYGEPIRSSVDDRDWVHAGDAFYRVRVTVELVTDKRGRPIIRRARKGKE